MVAAARDAVIDEFCRSLPDGYDTVPGELGAMLSGGQRQRIALARAVLKDAPVLVMDEAVSNLDTVSERQVSAAMDRVRAGRTTLVIAHRLSTIRSADRVVVVEGGRVAASGRHGEVLATSPTYRRLVETQLTGPRASRSERRHAGSLSGGSAVGPARPSARDTRAPPGRLATCDAPAIEHTDRPQGQNRPCTVSGSPTGTRKVHLMSHHEPEHDDVHAHPHSHEDVDHDHQHHDHDHEHTEHDHEHEHGSDTHDHEHAHERGLEDDHRHGHDQA